MTHSSSEAPEDLVVIGRLSRPFGVQGETRLVPESPESDWLFDLPEDRFFLLKPSAPPVSAGVDVRRWLGGVLLVKLDGIDSPEAAQLVNGALLAVREADRPATDEDAFYADQLPGLRVIGPEGQAVGEVARVVDSRGETFIEVLRTEGGTFLLSPAKELIEQIDLEAREIRLRMVL